MDPYVYIQGRRAHVVLAEKALGKPLPRGAVVHHVDGDGRNNKNNLVVCPSQKYHALLHYRTRALEEAGNASYKQCKFCKSWGDADNYPGVWGTSNPARGDIEFFHRACVNMYNTKRKLGYLP